MARIPTLLSDPMRDVMPSSGSPAMATPDAFGASVGEAQALAGARVGQATQQFGQALVATGVAVGDYAQAETAKKNKSATANGIANFDFTGDYLELQKTPPPEGMSYAQVVDNAYTDKVRKYVDTLPDGEVRAQVNMALMAQKPQFISSAQQFQNKEAVALDRAAADTGVTLQTNRVRADGSIDTYNDALIKINGVIDGRPNVTPAQKTLMKQASAEQLAMARFEGLVSKNADSPEALAALENELTVEGSPWKERMSPQVYDRTLDKIRMGIKAGNSQETTAARSAINELTQRNTDGIVISEAELGAARDIVMRSKNPGLLSSFAMISRAQQIYRDHRELPIEQQREKIAAMTKSKGVEGLPEPVRVGIVEGSNITGGQISQEYLSGLAGIEYGQHIFSGDYGKRTGGKNADGSPASDATGITQFISTTWLSTIKRHASTLGLDLTGKSDAQIAEMRKDPVLALKAGALHTLDNKQEMETRLGRPVQDSDLYFAHLLGVGGGTRFLNAAMQEPQKPAYQSVSPEQVAGNKAIFYDENGLARSNAQVRSYIANAFMNNQSRVDYAGVKAAQLTLTNTVKGLKDDPVTFAGTTGRFGDMGDLSSADGIRRRGIVVGQIAEYYRIPSADLKPFTKDEAEGLAKKARDGTAEETLQVMQQIQALGTPEAVRAGNKQIGEKDTVFGYAASIAYNVPGQSGVASDIIRGEKRMKEDKDVVAKLGTEGDIQAEFTKIVGPALAGTKLGTDTRKAAMAYYIEKYVSRGGATALDPTQFNESVNAVLGGYGNPGSKAVDTVNGRQTLLPVGTSAADFNTALRRMGDVDYVALAKWGSAPRYESGTPATAAEIAREGTFEAIGGGEYRVKMGDGKYLLSGAYKDGSADYYIFRALPDKIKEIATRSAAQYGPTTTRPLAQPRVIANP